MYFIAVIFTIILYNSLYFLWYKGEKTWSQMSHAQIGYYDVWIHLFIAGVYLCVCGGGGESLCGNSLRCLKPPTEFIADTRLELAT